jgi:hypothetical protein
MKKINSFYFLFAVCILVGCGGNGGDDKYKTQLDLPQDSTAKLILSIPDWAMDAMISDSTASCQLDSLKALKDFDYELFQSLFSGQNTIGNFELTKKFNPCCPCTPGGRNCCACGATLYLVSPTSMLVTVKVSGGEPLTPDPNYNGTGVDIFNIPDSAVGKTLIIDGKSIPDQLNFKLD